MEERGALLMVGRLTEAAALALRVHLLQAERDCNSAPVDLPGDLKVLVFSCLHKPCHGSLLRGARAQELQVS